MTICLRRDETDWPFCIQDLGGETKKIIQRQGDAILYLGKLLHWREGPFQGGEQTQVFLHYFNSIGPYVAHSVVTVGKNVNISFFRHRESRAMSTKIAWLRCSGFFALTRSE